MANPQKENGFTAIANEILEAVQMFKFTQNQLKVILALWRNTYGWSRKTCEFSLTYIEKTTNLDRKRANETLKSLIDGNVIIEIEKGTSTKSKVVAFNKNYKEWLIPKYKSSGEITTSGQNATSGETETTTSGHSATTTSGQNATHKRNIKEILNKEVVVVEEKNPIQFYQENFIHLTPFQIQSLWQWIDDFNGNEDVINLAIEQTAKTNPRNPFNYLEGILRKWHQKKLFTVEDVMKERERYEQTKVVRLERKKASEIDWEAL